MSRSVAVLAGAIIALIPGAAAAQAIEFKSELPRTLVFIQERGDAQVATRDLVAFLRQANFPLVDPAMAQTAAQKPLVDKAINGDEAAAVELGKSFGAQVLILGKADWGTTIDPLTQRLQTGTAEVDVRAIRLDDGKVLATARANGREVDATEQMARTKAIREAVTQIVEQTELVGALANNWEEQPWSTRGYFKPEPGSVGAAVQGTATRGTPRLAIIRTDVLPPLGAASRGIGVVKKADPNSGVKNDVRIEGIAIGQISSVVVEGTKASIEPVEPAEARKLGIEGSATRFIATLTLPANKDTVKVTATSSTGETAVAMASPRIAQKWAVIVGVGEYRNEGITDLRYAGKDAQSVYDFLRSSAAGPFDQDHILLLKDAQATGQAIREALFVFLQKANYNDLVVIYFAGHGTPDPTRPGNLYLLPHDADLKALASTGFPMWDVKTALSRHIKAERVIVIADACHSGAAREGMTNPINGSFEELFTPSRRVILTAADDNELSHEDARWGGGHGVFTFNLIEGLKGSADADKNGIVTFSEVSDYVAGKVKVDTNGRQSPQRGGLGDIPLAEVARTASTGGGH
jgi:uncharacterized caspase-like protein